MVKVCLDACCSVCSQANAEWRASERELGSFPQFAKSVFSFLPELHKNSTYSVVRSPPALSLPNAAATVRFPTGGGMRRRKPLLFLTWGVALHASLGAGIVVSL